MPQPLSIWWWSTLGSEETQREEGAKTPSVERARTASADGAVRNLDLHVEVADAARRELKGLEGGFLKGRPVSELLNQSRK